jgi:hypothetical protein
MPAPSRAEAAQIPAASLLQSKLQELVIKPASQASPGLTVPINGVESVAHATSPAPPCTPRAVSGRDQTALQMQLPEVDITACVPPAPAAPSTGASSLSGHLRAARVSAPVAAQLATSADKDAQSLSMPPPPACCPKADMPPHPPRAPISIVHKPIALCPAAAEQTALQPVQNRRLNDPAPPMCAGQSADAFGRVGTMCMRPPPPRLPINSTSHRAPTAARPSRTLPNKPTTAPERRMFGNAYGLQRPCAVLSTLFDKRSSDSDCAQSTGKASANKSAPPTFVPTTMVDSVMDAGCTPVARDKSPAAQGAAHHTAASSSLAPDDSPGQNRKRKANPELSGGLLKVHSARFHRACTTIPMPALSTSGLRAEDTSPGTKREHYTPTATSSPVENGLMAHVEPDTTLHEASSMEATISEGARQIHMHGFAVDESAVMPDRRKELADLNNNLHEVCQSLCPHRSDLHALWRTMPSEHSLASIVILCMCPTVGA